MPDPTSAAPAVRDHRTLCLPFTGGRAAVGRLTWAQQLLWRDSVWLRPDDAYFNLVGCLVPPPARSVDDVLAACRAVVERHEVLRSRIEPDADDRPRQRVHPRGELSVEVVEAAGPDVDDAVAVLIGQFRGRSFHFPPDWLVRLGIVTREGAAVRLVLALSHVAVDFAGWRRVADEIESVLAGSASPESLPPVVRQPLEQAEFEASPRGQHRSAQSLKHWERVLSRAPQTTFPVRPAAPEEPRFRRARLTSRALDHAVSQLGLRHQVSTSNVLMAVVAALLGRYAGTDLVVLKLILSNRGHRELRDMVCVTLGNALAALDVGEGTVGGLIRQAAEVALVANRRAQCDPAELARLTAAVEVERGISIDLSCFFNDFRADSAPIAEAADLGAANLGALRATTSIEWIGEWQRQNAKFFFHADTDDTGGLRVYLMVDTAVMPSAHAERFLVAMEALALAACADDLALAAIPTVAEVGSVSRPSGLSVDRCWVSLDDTRALAEAALQPDALGLFAVPGDAGPQLEAHLAGCRWIDPVEAHRALMARLEGHLTAIAPARYYLYAAAPADPHQRSAWMRLTPLGAGTGRPG